MQAPRKRRRLLLFFAMTFVLLLILSCGAVGIFITQAQSTIWIRMGSSTWQVVPRDSRRLRGATSPSRDVFIGWDPLGHHLGPGGSDFICHSTDEEIGLPGVDIDKVQCTP